MISKLLVRALAVGVLAAARFSSAQAQPCSSFTLPNGTILTCRVVNGQKVYILNDTLHNATSTGTGTFMVTNTTTNPCTAVLSPVGILVTSNTQTLGLVTTTLDPTRPATPSKIQSLTVGTDFPAREDIFFYVQTTISSRPGKQYRSIREVHLTAIVNSFNPHTSEVCTLVQPVDFEEVNNPGPIAFTLQSLRVILGAPQ
jgi:hypothetical protein